MTCENISGYHLIVVEGLWIVAQHQALELKPTGGVQMAKQISGENLDRAARLRHKNHKHMYICIIVLTLTINTSYLLCDLFPLLKPGGEL